MDKTLRSGLRGISSVANAHRPFIRNRFLTIPSFFAGWFATEAPQVFAAGHVVGILRGLRRGDHRNPSGTAGLALKGAAVAGYSKLWLDGRRTDDEMSAALAGHLDAADLAARPHSGRGGELVPFVGMGLSHRVITRRVPYIDGGAYRNTLEVHLPKGPIDTGAKRPVVVQVHGGGWVVGNAYEQGQPLLSHLVRNGWIGFAINYRLAPKARFPDQLIDVKRALAWVKLHAAEYGGDPDFVVVTGGSAGGYLTAMTALTENDPEFQPGFEDADTSVQAAMPVYGVYDLTNDDHSMVWGFEEVLMRQWVMGTRLADDRERYERYSPVHRVHAAAPPMMIVHGTLDTLVPIEHARPFAAEMARVSEHAVVYAELTGANHAFDIFESTRTVRFVEYAERFFDGARRGVLK